MYNWKITGCSIKISRDNVWKADSPVSGTYRFQASLGEFLHIQMILQVTYTVSPIGKFVSFLSKASGLLPFHTRVQNEWKLHPKFEVSKAA